MNNILCIEDYLFENTNPRFFSENEIRESLNYLESEDPAIMEAWYNTVLDFAALIPGIGSVAEGINLVSYAKQGEYLLAGLCAIGLIPLFGQYIGAGGSILVKVLKKGMGLGASILKPLTNMIAKFFPKIVGFLKSSKFLAKFSGIGPFIGKMISSLKNFVVGGGSKLKALATNPGKIKELTTSVREYTREAKMGKKAYDWIFSPKDQPKISTTPSTVGYSGYTDVNPAYQIPVPKDAYMAYRGTPLKNIRPYTDTEITQAETQDWERYL
ncbi:MAG: hypothetical protein EBS19_01330 [Spirochaetia bacterium]|nr:hypothetical protein [Spirochaetia bacterium]